MGTAAVTTLERISIAAMQMLLMCHHMCMDLGAVMSTRMRMQAMTTHMVTHMGTHTLRMRTISTQAINMIIKVVVMSTVMITATAQQMPMHNIRSISIMQ